MFENRERAIWGIEPGTPGLSRRLFRESCAAAVQWEGIGDLSHLPPRLSSFQSFIQRCRPELPQPKVLSWARRTYEFVHVMQFQDWVVQGDTDSHEVHIAFVSGPYYCTQKLDLTHPHIRKIHWCQAIPRSRFSAEALAEIDTPAEFFKIVNFAEEITAILDERS
jgi:predicted Mrr-cat superfamily restriction endonuclease